MKSFVIGEKLETKIFPNVVRYREKQANMFFFLFSANVNFCGIKERRREKERSFSSFRHFSKAEKKALVVFEICYAISLCVNRK